MLEHFLHDLVVKGMDLHAWRVHHRRAPSFPDPGQDSCPETGRYTVAWRHGDARVDLEKSRTKMKTASLYP